MELTSAQREAKARFEAFTDAEVQPIVDRCEKAEEMCLKLIRRLAEEGYFGLTLPQAYGGQGADMVTYALLHRQIGLVWTSLRNLLTVHTMVAHAICRWGTDVLKNLLLPGFASGERFAAFCLTEPMAGSDATMIQSTAVRVDGGFQISGEKRWITGGEIASTYLVLARSENGISAFVVDRETPGLTVRQVRGILGSRASMLADLSFRDCFVPSERVVGAMGAGFSGIGNTVLDLGRFSVACGCAGMAAACLNTSLQYASARVQFGALVREHQLVQQMLTRCAVNAHAAWLLCYEAALLRDARHPDVIAKTAMAKYFASRAAMSNASDAVQIHGANGCSEAFPVSRFYRDAKIMEIIEGSTQILESLIARML
jgi:glutaryl-CoA dehydrogenase (non-decarboxylating)